MASKKVALVTGASSGIGEETAKGLLAAGYTVFAGARRVSRMKQLADAGAKVLALDVIEDTSMVAAVDTVLREAGRIDVLVTTLATARMGLSKTCRSRRRGVSSRSTCSASRG